MGTLQAEAESKEAEQVKKKHSAGGSTSLSALILGNQQSRARQMNSFFDDLAAKYGAGQNKAAKTASKSKTVAKKSAAKTSNTSKRNAPKSQTKSKAKK